LNVHCCEKLKSYSVFVKHHELHATGVNPIFSTYRYLGSCLWKWKIIIWWSHEIFLYHLTRMFLFVWWH
jgi:hypothetical protein